jgi:hypothetical protein
LIAAIGIFCYLYIFKKYIQVIENKRPSLFFKVWLLLLLAIISYLVETVMLGCDDQGLYFFMLLLTNDFFLLAHWEYCWSLYRDTCIDLGKYDPRKLALVDVSMKLTIVVSMGICQCITFYWMGIGTQDHKNYEKLIYRLQAGLNSFLNIVTLTVLVWAI